MCIISYIRHIGGHAERVNSIGQMIDNRKHFTDTLGFHRTVGAVTWIRSSGQRGTADISARYNGVSIKIEVKIGRDRQSPTQASCQRQIEAAGGVYYFAKDFESFYQWFNEKFMT